MRLGILKTILHFNGVVLISAHADNVVIHFGYELPKDESI